MCELTLFVDDGLLVETASVTMLGTPTALIGIHFRAELLKLMKVGIVALIVGFGVVMAVIELDLLVREVLAKESFVLSGEFDSHLNDLLVGDGLRETGEASISHLVELEELLYLGLFDELIIDCGRHSHVLAIIPDIIFLLIFGLVALIVGEARFERISRLQSLQGHMRIIDLQDGVLGVIRTGTGASQFGALL